VIHPGVTVRRDAGPVQKTGPAFVGQPVSTPSRRWRTHVYIDGFNLYYGFYKRPAPSHWSRYKWLNLERFCEVLLPDNDIVAVKYYTAEVRNMPPGYQQKRRQRKYLKALSSLPRVEVVKGLFLKPKPVRRLRCDSEGKPIGGMAWVLRTEEKGSDVNLGVDLVHDAIRDLFECAVIVSNDSDLVRPVSIAKKQYGKVIGLVNPHAHHQHMAWDLRDLADFTKSVIERTLADSQFPDEVSTPWGIVTRPSEWH